MGKCTACELHKTSQCNAMPGRGKRGGILFLGEAPAEVEEREGRPFVGPAGQVLDHLIEDAKLGKYPIFRTNAIRCRLPYGRKPSIDEIRTCRDEHLLAEIKRVKPRLIVALGTPAAKSVTNSDRARITRMRGFMDNWDGIPVLYAFHPSYVQRNISQLVHLEKDFKKIIVHLKWGSTEVGASPAWRVCGTKKIGMDIETNGRLPLDPKCKVILGSIATDPQHVREYDLTATSQRIAFRNALRSCKTIIGHNLPFDTIACIHHFGWDFLFDKEWVDTALLFSARFPDYPNMGLKHLAPIWCRMAPYKSPFPLSRPFDWQKLTRKEWRDFKKYNGLDAIATYRLYEEFSDVDNPLLPAWLSTLQKIATKMELVGIRIDRMYATRLLRELTSRADDIKQDLDPVDTNSAIQIREHVYGALGLTCTTRTKTGIRSVADSVLEQLEPEDHTNWIREYRKLKELRTQIDRYATPLVRDVDTNGIYHPHFFVAKFKTEEQDKITRGGGTNTGRITAGLLSLIPRGADIKRLFRSRWSDGVMVVADYSQNELRVLADLSGDPTMLDLFERGADIHRETTAAVLGIEPEDVTTTQRQWIGKKLNFAIVYGASAETVLAWIRMGWLECPYSVYQAQKLIDKLWEQWPVAHDYMLGLQRQAIEKGFIQSPTGRHFPFADAWHDKHLRRAAANSPIQSGSGDINNAALELFANELWDRDGFPVNTVYDSIVLDLRKYVLRELGGEKWVRRVMVKDVPRRLARLGWRIKVPLVVDIHIGKRWAA